VVSFIGFLPAEDPQLLCLVVVDNPQKERWGGHIAAPAFQRVMGRVLRLGEGLPRAGVEEAENTVVVAVPELRGMTRERAAYQTQMRGLAVEFAGRGEVVVRQVPEPGAASAAAGRITCTLGSAEEIPATGLDNTPRRQKLLLRSLRRDRLIVDTDSRPAATPRLQ
jgi:hypothetical protein